MTCLTLQVPPSANRYWRVWRGRARPSAEAGAYKAGVARACAVARLRPLEGPVRVELRWYRSRKAGDLDNRLKVLLDALQGWAFEKDSQVVEIHAYRHEDKERPRVEVTVSPVEG